MSGKSILDLKKMRDVGAKISWITCYDYPGAVACQAAGIDMILVGDSGVMCQYGEKSTTPATMEDQIRMTRAVRKGAPDTFIVGDMPFGSYEVSNEEAVANAIRLIKEGECDAIKLEGGERIRPRLKALKDAGILVIGHLGLTPQSSVTMGGYKVQGKSIKSIVEMAKDIDMMIGLNIDMVLMEAIPDKVSSVYLDTFGDRILIMGIGAGPHAHGQLLIYHDVLGLYPDFRPKFARNFWEYTTTKPTALEQIQDAINMYIHCVQAESFPSRSESYSIKVKDLPDFSAWSMLLENPFSIGPSDLSKLDTESIIDVITFIVSKRRLL